MPKKGENIRKRKDGRWEARYTKGHGSDGKAVIVSLYGKSYREVRQKRYQAIEEYEDETRYEDDGNIKVADLSFKWLENTKENFKESTYFTYKTLIENHIGRYFRSCLASNVTKEKLEEFAKHLRTNGRADGKGGLSGGSVGLIQSLLKQILEYGKANGYVCRTSHLGGFSRMRKSSIAVPNARELEKLETFLKRSHDPCCFGILFSMYTGIRIGELCSMKWGDVDVENAVIRISKTLQRIPDVRKEDGKTKVVIGNPKTDSSVRTIPLPPVLSRSLGEHQKAADCFVLTGTKNYMEPRCLRYRYKSYLKACGIKNYRFHSLRHAFANRCVEKGFDAKTLSEILGHSNVSTTLRIYTHPSLELKRSYMERL